MNFIDPKKIKILFLGTSSISAYVLENLILHSYNIIGIISQTDKSRDRKGNLLFTETKKIGIKYNIKVYQFEKLSDNFEQIKQIQPDLILTISYGKIVPEKILEIPQYGSLNLHGSILPVLRGAAPIQRALIEGFDITGFSLMKMVKDLDAGEVYAKKIIKIEKDDNYSSLYEKMKVIAYEIFDENISNYLNNKIVGEVQDITKVSYANKITSFEEKLDINYTTRKFLNYIRGLSYKPGAYLFFNDKKIKLLKAQIFSNEIKKQVGYFYIENKRHLCLQLKDGIIEILLLQLEGKKITDSLSFINGHKEQLNVILK